MLALETARERLLAALAQLPEESIVIPVADGRILAADCIAHVDLPPFDNSTMDGYAVRAADLTSTPAVLNLVGRMAAGDLPTSALGPRECVRIFTGAPLPIGADAVVMQEDTEIAPATPDRVVVLDGVKPWENVRFRGEDVRCGATLVSAGTRLGPPHLALLGAAGHAEVTVYRTTRVAILANGSELRAPGEVLAPGQIYESNTAMLAALVRRAGGVVVFNRCVPDDPVQLAAAMAEAFAQADLVVTVGGASVGDHDLIKPVFAALGGELDFWKISLKPGKPFCFGRLGEKYLFGLPGNPVSAFVTAVLLLQPALRRMQGAAVCEPPTTLGILGAPLSNPGDRRHFVRVVSDAAGHVRSAGAQASHLLGSLAAADGLVDVPPQTTLAAGAAVQVIRW
jgi:molybdopterin molybdotransferase